MGVECAVAVPAYSICAADSADDARSATIQAWRGNLSGCDELQGERFDALFVRSPFGAPALRFIVDGSSGRRVGVAALAPRLMSLGGDEVRVGVVSHLAIDPEHRSLGPALMLLDELLAAGAGRFDFIYGLPRNSEGADAALRRAGLKPVGVMERHIKLVRHGFYLARRLPALLAPVARLVGWIADVGDRFRGVSPGSTHETEWVKVVDGRMDQIWATSGPGTALTATRDARMLGWRFDQSADPITRYLVVSDAVSGEARAWFACDVDPQWPHILDVQDFWSAEPGGTPTRALVESLVRQARRDGYSAISIHICGPDTSISSWRSVGFVERGRQQIFGCWLNQGLRAGGPPDLHFTNIDLDG
ncbi:hypothetical protein [Lysobacter sp. A421]